jgi:hypothetical protein
LVDMIVNDESWYVGSWYPTGTTHWSRVQEAHECHEWRRREA